jgi:trk system potassium uptake protein TrkA
VRVVIIGCGRTGAMLAEVLDAAGHSVLIMDVRTSAFGRLPHSFKGEAVRGDGTDEGALRRAGAAEADLFLTLTEGDNRNIMAAQLARESLGARRVIAKVNDSVRAQAYAELGIGTVCRTTMIADALLGAIGEPATGTPWLFDGQTHEHGEGSPVTGPIAGRPIRARED